MKTKLIKIVFVLIAVISFSCSSDSENNNNQQDDVSLTQKIVYLPQSINFDNKLVTNYVNNQRINEINYNASEEITQTREFTYGSGTSTASTFDPQHLFQGKTIYNYDSLNRITTIEFYTSQNQLSGTRNFDYQGTDINVSYIQNGVSTPLYLYKTNSNNLIYYEKYIPSGLEQTLTYSGNVPIQLVASSGLQMVYEYFQTTMPTAIQNDATGLNNSILVSTIQQIKDSGNYYLKKIIYPGFYMKYEREFNADNYITHDLRTSVINTPPDEQINSETFYYYN
jgi:hypothetical protein